jgi:hypothetical protein
MVYSCFWIAVWGWVRLEEVTVASWPTYPDFYVTRRFSALFSRAGYSPLTWARWIQFTTSYAARVRTIFVLSFRLSLSLPIGICCNFLYICLISYVSLTHFHPLFLWFDYQNNILKVQNHENLHYVNLFSSFYSLFCRSVCSSQYPPIKRHQYLFHVTRHLHKTKSQVLYFSDYEFAFFPFQILGYTHHQDNIIHSFNRNFGCLPSKPTADLSVSTAVTLLIVSSNDSL